VLEGANLGQVIRPFLGMRTEVLVERQGRHLVVLAVRVVALERLGNELVLSVHLGLSALPHTHIKTN
jgi:hypothetical protein